MCRIDLEVFRAAHHRRVLSVVFGLESSSAILSTVLAGGSTVGLAMAVVAAFFAVLSGWRLWGLIRPRPELIGEHAARPVEALVDR